MSLPIDLDTTPFSRRGSWFAVSRLPAGRGEAPGVHLRTVRGSARHREILRLVVGGSTTPAVIAGAARLELRHGGSSVEIVLSGAGRALLRVTGTATLDFRATGRYDAVVPERRDAWRFINSGAAHNYRIRVAGGARQAARLEAAFDEDRNTEARLVVTADGAPVLVTIDEYGSAVPTTPDEDVASVAAAAEADFEAWAARHGAGDPLPQAARLAAFVTWAALVPADGALRRESMLMSKNGMTHVWSWDHCFNAMALWRDPAAAADQLLSVFDHQDEHGCLPDFVDDVGANRNFVKPPVHGWAVGWLMDRGGLPDATVAALYEPLRRWTDWWWDHRVYGEDAIPSYNHGNDSGWDNSTVFGAGVPVQSPDLLAFLALQMHTLARIADGLGRPDEAAAWRRRAAGTVETLTARFWVGDRFVARETLSQRVVDSDSLLTLMPLVLGDRLPAAQFDRSVRRLCDGGYLTEFGPATEPLHSRHYVGDGYWRGPIWAPSTMLLIDGLRRGGRPDLAEQIGSAFLSACAAQGMAENFDATTGTGLRDRSMTWTASVFLTLLGDKVRRPPHTSGTDLAQARRVRPVRRV